MAAFPETRGFFRNGRKPRQARFSAVAVCLSLACLILTGCAPRRVSYNVWPLYIDPHFSARALSNNDIAVLPLLTSEGPITEGGPEGEELLKRLRTLRPDLRLVSHTVFENGFPPRFDRREISEFYDRLFREDVLAIKGMDALWEGIEQPYLLVYTLKDGAVIKNMDESVFKHVSVTCEIWNRDGRGVVWRASARGVSDDRRVSDREILVETMRRLAEAIPAFAPDYGRESW
jgi:hypothetical protein